MHKRFYSNKKKDGLDTNPDPFILNDSDLDKIKKVDYNSYLELKEHRNKKTTFFYKMKQPFLKLLFL